MTNAEGVLLRVEDLKTYFFLRRGVLDIVVAVGVALPVQQEVTG
jgi:hypothetical protein